MSAMCLSRNTEFDFCVIFEENSKAIALISGGKRGKIRHESDGRILLFFGQCVDRCVRRRGDLTSPVAICRKMAFECCVICRPRQVNVDGLLNGKLSGFWGCVFRCFVGKWST
jgi:hypothetical protein